jgi:hypothetical protein
MRRLTKHIFPESSQKKQERKELDEASRLVQLRYRQGALYFDISRPTEKDKYIRAQVHRYTVSKSAPGANHGRGIRARMLEL